MERASDIRAERRISDQHSISIETHDSLRAVSVCAVFVRVTSLSCYCRAARVLVAVPGAGRTRGGRGES
jgi:hypothetical protein